MSTEQKVCGGFVVNAGDSEIVISRPEGKWSVFSSSKIGYSETPDLLTLTNDRPKSDGFTIITSADVKTASIVTETHKMTSVSALVTADPDPLPQKS